MPRFASWLFQATLVALFVVASSFLPFGARADAAKRGTFARSYQRNGLMVGAREVPGRRTVYSSTYRNPDGTMTTSISATPANFVDGRGRLRRIDSRLVTAHSNAYAWRNGANRFALGFKQVTSAGFLTLGLNSRRFVFSLAGSDGSARGSVHGDSLSYTHVLDGVDLDYVVKPDGLKETVRLASADAPSHYRFLMTAGHGARLRAERQPGGAWAIFDAVRPEPLFVLEAPTAADSPPTPPRGHDEGPAKKSDFHGASEGHVAMSVRKAGGHFVIDVAVDRHWLRSPDRVFPVLVDPTITIQGTSQFGNFDWTCSTCVPTTDDRVFIGTTDTKIYRSALQFGLTSIPAGATITDAQLRLYYDGMCLLVGTNPCQPRTQQFDALRLTQPWSTSSTTGSLQFAPTPVASVNFSTIADADVQWLSWNLTQTVKDWALGVAPNNGVLMKLNNETLGASGIRPPSGRFAEGTVKPKLDVTYTGDAVSLLPITANHADGAELQWTKYVGESGAPFDRYEIHRSPTGKFTPTSSTLVATVRDINVTRYRDTTAAPGKTFYYKIVANTSASNEQSTTTPGDGKATRTIQSTDPASVDGKATTITYTPGSSSQCANLGSDRNLRLEADPTATRRVLLYVDLRDVPTTATVNAARLSLWRPYANNFGTTVDLHRVTRDWEEGTGEGTCTGDGASWSESQGGVAWSAAGGDYDATPAKSLTTSTAAAFDNYYIEPLVGQWVNGTYPNLGVLLKLHDETPLTGHQFDYYSDDFSVAPSLRPKLYLNYTDGSHAIAPTVSVAAPGPGDLVSGTAVSISAAASDDRRVDKVEFLVDNLVVATDTTAPFAATWSSTGATNGTHSLTARATDDAGNVTTSSATSVTVDNTAVPATSVTAPAANATVSGSAVTVAANASGGEPISRVEFYVDGNRLADDTTAPYSVTWNTLDTGVPSYDGQHTLATKAYDSAGRVATSIGQTVTTANTSATKFKAGFSSTEVPQSVIYDPAAATQDKTGVDVTVTNTSTVTWLSSDVVLRYRWYSPDASPVVTTGSDVPLTANLAPGASTTLRVLADPPLLPDGVDKAQYRLQLDLYSKTSAAYFADKGNKPLENPVIVNKALVRDALGVESYYRYVASDVGADMQQLVNIANGNALLRWEPLTSAGRGVGTTLSLTYNALEKKCECPAGNNWSVAVSSLTRFGLPIDVHPNKADSIAGRSNKYIELTDADGTTHRFTSSDGLVYKEPAGVHLYLRKYSDTDTAKKWALTTPDRVTYFYDVDGYPTSVTDRNGNAITFTETAVDPADDPGGPRKHVTAVIDASQRSYAITYWTKADAKKPQVRGKIKRITDHSGHALDFDYYEDGNLLRITQRGGTKADGSFLADRSLVFTYTTSDGSGPAIPNIADRVNPDPKTPNESTRIYSIRDPRGKETTLAYLGPGYGTDRWKLASSTDRSVATTTYGYDTVNRVTTVTAPLSRVTKFGYDTDGKATSITEPNGAVTRLAWTPDRMVSRVTGADGTYVDYAYNDNGLVTDVWDQLRNHTLAEYDSFAVDSGDVAANWTAGRTIPHLSQLVRVTSPRGTATTTAGDFQWQLAYDGKGNLTKATDPLGYPTTYAYNTNGTVASVTDANGHVETYNTYDGALPTKITDATGGVTQLGYDADGRLLWTQDAIHAAETGSDTRSYRSYFDYDSFGRLGRSSEPKSTASQRGMLIWTDVDYDANDNVVAQRAPAFADATGTTTTTTFDAMDRPMMSTVADTTADPNGLRTAYAYDAAGRLTSVTLPNGVATASTDKDYATFYKYDSNDRPTQTTRYAVDATGAVVQTLNSFVCYDAVGNVKRQTAPGAGLSSVDCSSATPPADTTSYTYDAAGKLLNSTDPGGNTTSWSYDADGNSLTLTDENGVTLTGTYNARGDLTKEVQPFDNAGTTPRDLTTVYDYDGVGNLAREISPRAWDASTDKTTFKDYVTAYKYDAGDRLVRVDLPTAGGSTPTYLHKAYDAVGDLLWSSDPATASDPALVASTNKTSFTYFDSGAVRSTDAPGVPRVSYEYDAAGQQTSRTPDDASGAPDPTQRMTWSYTPSELLAQTVDQGGQVTTFGYDADGNATTATVSDGLVSPGVSRATILMSYDSLDQLTKLRHKQQTDANYTAETYGYNLDGDVTSSEEDAVEDPNGVVLQAGRKRSLTYTPAGLLATETDFGFSTGSADDRRLSLGWSPAGQELSRTLARPDGASGWATQLNATSTYYRDGTLKTTTAKNAAGETLASDSLRYVDAQGIYADGNPASDTFMLAGPDSAAPCVSTTCTTNYTYDPRGRLSQAQYVRGAVTSSLSYVLDPDGNVTQRTKDGDVTTYTYGAADQLTTSTHGSDARKYFHSRTGELDCVTTSAGSPADCHPAAGASVSPTLINDYTYDYAGRFAAVRAYTAGTPKRSAVYVYDGLARLVNRSETRPTGTRVSSFAYIGASDRPRTEDQRNGSGSLQKTKAFLYSGGRLAGIAVTPTGAGTTNYAYDSDPAGDVSQLVDDGGAARASYAYDPYGASDGALSRGDVDPEDPTNPFRYGAKAFDSGSQTLDMGARRFDADTARFVQRDSFTDASADLDLGLDETGSNRYALAAGNPIGLGELDGHLTYRRFLNGIRLTPLQRRQMFAHFFRVFRGTKSHYRWDWGFGRGLGQFLGWEIASGRIRPDGQGSQWWKGVNGWMAQDLRDAQRLLKRGKRRSAVRDVNLWMKYGIESHRGRTTRSRQQAALWNAHQHSVHCGIAFGSGVYFGEPHSEQDFIRYAIKAVDLAAIAQRPTDSDEIVFPVSQIYTQHYPANGGDVNELYNFLILAIISGKLPADKNSGIDTTRWQPAC